MVTASVMPGTFGDLEAWVEFLPGGYCMGEAIKCPSCDEGHAGNHGRWSCTMRWYLRGHDLAVRFVVYTGWLASVDPLGTSTPLAADIGFHSNRPMYDGMDPMTGTCDVLNGVCYYDGSGIGADEGWQILRDEGSDAVWAWMHGWFTHWLDKRAAFDRGSA